MPGVRYRYLVVSVTAAALLGLGSAGCSRGGGETGSTATTTAAVESGAGAGEDAAANTLSIDMRDYAFAISGEVKAGTSTVSLRNSGAEMHMAAFGRLQEGRTMADVQAALQSEDDSAFDSVLTGEIASPGTILSPGRSEEITTDFLGAGHYAVICFIPTAGEATQIPHAAKGMLAEFEVGAGDVGAAGHAADATYTVDDGRIDGPRSLRAGRNAIRMTSAGKGPHEFYVVKKRQPNTTYADVDTFFTNLFEGDKPPPKGYPDTAPGVIHASTFDVASGRSIVVTVDLEPGDYLIGCAREPDESEGAAAAPHTGEILDVTVT